jgi:hypothetical protein
MKPHKFFEDFLDINLGNLKDKMMLFRENLIYGNVVDIPGDVLSKYQEEKSKPESEITSLAGYYNIFNLGFSELDILRNKLGDLVLEACSYYSLDHEPLDYQIRGWLNVTYGSSNNKGIERPEIYNLPESFHEHNDGKGMPDMHGYYCVTAEPSITHYLIDKITLFENHNINNRVVLSETGHPHRIDMWEYDSPRITIAYDICPKENQDDGISVPLW